MKRVFPTHRSIAAFSRVLCMAFFLLLCSCGAEPTVEMPNMTERLTLTSFRLDINVNTAHPLRPSKSTNITDITGEDDINSIIIGVFSADGTELRTLRNLDFSVPVEFVASVRQGDIILTAANVAEDNYTTVKTAAQFKAVTLDAATALGVTSGSATNNNIPMFGTATINDIITAQLTLTVARLISKITVNSLKVDFAAGGPYDGAEFTPTEIFLTNVPDGLVAAGTPYLATPAFLQGESTNTTGQAVCLGTGVLAGQTALSRTAPNFSGTTLLYTTPNNTSTKTRLVIKGTFVSGSSDTSTPTAGGTYYYPIILDEVEPNTNYTFDITINGFGVASPDDNFTNIDNQTVNVGISDFDAVSGSSSIYNEGFSVTVTATDFTAVTSDVALGTKKTQFLYSDGTWGEYTPVKTPIAIVFSFDVTATDKAEGYKGYAMALKDANGGAVCTWSTNTASTVTSDVSNEATSAVISSRREGLTNTRQIKQADGYSATTYPAAYYALNYGVASSGVSEWFLPAIGQLFDIAVNLGEMAADSYPWADNGLCRTNINNKMSVVGTSNYEEMQVWSSSTESTITSQICYWGSSESSYAIFKTALRLTAEKTQLAFQYNYSNGTTYKLLVRPVIAFGKQ